MSKFTIIILFASIVIGLALSRPQLRVEHVEGDWISLPADDLSTYRFHFDRNGKGRLAVHRLAGSDSYYILIYQFDWEIKRRVDIEIQVRNKTKEPKIKRLEIQDAAYFAEAKLRISDRRGVQRIRLAKASEWMEAQKRLSEAIDSYDPSTSTNKTVPSGTYSGDFSEFFLRQGELLGLGSPETGARNFDFDETSWKFRFDQPTGSFDMLVSGLTFEQVTDFFEELYGEPDSIYGENALFDEEKLSVTIFREAKGVRIICVNKLRVRKRE